MFDVVVLGITLLAFVPSFLVTNAAMPFLISRMAKRGITGTDMNKFSKPRVPEMGGIGVFFGLVAGISVTLGVLGYFDFFAVEINLTSILAAFLTTLVVGFIGVFDDLIGWKNGIRQWQHALFPFFAALPLMVLPQSIGTTEVTLPFFGIVSFGIFYSLLLVPIAITGASNAVNMLAGLNGLEAGLGSIISFSMLLTLFSLPIGHPGSIEAIILMSSLLGSLIAFLKYNWFPAKIFGGDSLTLMIGASIAAASIIGSIEKIGLLFFALYFIELAVKSKHKMQSESFGIAQKDGTLVPSPNGGSLTHFVMRQGKFTEKQVVSIILGMQLVVSAIVLVLVYMKLL